MKPKHQNFKKVSISKGVTLKSGLEEIVFNFLKDAKVNFVYEGKKITYSMPETKKTYTVDFPITGSFCVETKGAFNSQDRKKHKIIKQQNPSLDLRFIFSNSKNKIGKKSQTTYAKWCDIFGFKYHCVASSKIPFPDEWIKEIKNAKKTN